MMKMTRLRNLKMRKNLLKMLRRKRRKMSQRLKKMP